MHAVQATRCMAACDGCPLHWAALGADLGTCALQSADKKERNMEFAAEWEKKKADVGH